MPPTGSTVPRRVISPVIATSPRTRRPVSSDTSATVIATPAEGPSFDTAPGGTWRWMSVFSKSTVIPRSSTCVRTHDRRRPRRFLHDVAELTGQDQVPLARTSREASMNRMSPPVGIQARPVATPGTSVRSAASE